MSTDWCKCILFVCLSILLPSALRAGDPVIRLIDFDYKTGRAMAFEDADMSGDATVVKPDQAEPLETLYVPRGSKASVRMSRDNPFLFTFTGKVTEGQSQGMQNFLALLTQLNVAFGKPFKGQEQSDPGDPVFGNYVIKFNDIRLNDLYKNINVVVDFAATGDELARTYTFLPHKFDAMVSTNDLARVQRAITELKKNQDAYAALTMFRFPSSKKSTIEILSITSSTSEAPGTETSLGKFEAADFLVGNTATFYGYTGEKQDLATPKKPAATTTDTTTGTVTTATGDGLSKVHAGKPDDNLGSPPAGTPSSAIELPSVVYQVDGVTLPLGVHKVPKWDALTLENFLHQYPNLVNTLQFFADKVSIQLYAELVTQCEQLLDRIARAQVALVKHPPVPSPPPSYKYNFRKNAVLVVEAVPVPADLYKDDLRAAQKNLAGKYSFKVEPVQRVTYALSLAAVYSFVNDHEITKDSSSKVQVSNSEDYERLNPGVLLNIYPTSWYDDIFEPFLQIGVQPEKNFDDLAFLLGVGFSADKGRFSVGAGVIYQRVDVLAPGITAGQEVKPDQTFKDEEFEAGLYIQFGLSFPL